MAKKPFDDAQLPPAATGVGVGTTTIKRPDGPNPNA